MVMVLQRRLECCEDYWHLSCRVPLCSDRLFSLGSRSGKPLSEIYTS